MDMATYIERLTQEVVTTAKIGGKETVDVVERLLPAVEAAFRLTLIEAVTKAAHDITLTLQDADVPATVATRLSGVGVDFVVHVSDTEPTSTSPEPEEPVTEDTSARITLRLSEQLKSRLETSAADAGQSVNTFIVQNLRAAVSQPAPGPGFPPIPPMTGGPQHRGPGRGPRPPRPPRGDGNRLQGWL